MTTDTRTTLAAVAPEAELELAPAAARYEHARADLLDALDHYREAGDRVLNLAKEADRLHRELRDLLGTLAVPDLPPGLIDRPRPTKG